MGVVARLRSPVLRGVWIGLACVLVSWLAVQLSFLRGLEDWMLDGCFSLRGRRSTSSRIVIVALDEPSLARVVQYARAQGATAIGIDVMIPADRARLADLQPGQEGDALTLGQAIVQAGNVTLPVWKLDQSWLRPVPSPAPDPELPFSVRCRRGRCGQARGRSPWPPTRPAATPRSRTSFQGSRWTPTPSGWDRRAWHA